MNYMQLLLRWLNGPWQCWAPVRVFLSSPNFPRIFASSLSTRLVSCSLFWQALMSDMNTCVQHNLLAYSWHINAAALLVT